MYTTAVNDLMLLFLFLMIGVVLRQIIKPLRKLYLPSGLIGGAAALIMGPQVLNLFAMPDTWSSMASPMINIVLTTTLFGIAINKSKMKSYAGAISSNMLSYFSQMLVGILAGVGLQKIWKGLPESWGVMTVFTYWGGHGAATSSGTLFEELGVEGMLSIGLILATLGLIVAMVRECSGLMWGSAGAGQEHWIKGETAGKEKMTMFCRKNRNPWEEPPLRLIPLTAWHSRCVLYF